MELTATRELGRDGEVVHFETGEPVRFEFLRNLESAPDFGPRYQQDIEPGGRYMLHAIPGALTMRGWVDGWVTFRNPLVIAFNADPNAPTLYNETSWKAQLHEAYDAVGKDLSRALAHDGYDGIVTVALDPDDRPMHTQEIIDLTWFHGPTHPARLRSRLMPH